MEHLTDSEIDKISFLKTLSNISLTDIEISANMGPHDITFNGKRYPANKFHWQVGKFNIFGMASGSALIDIARSTGMFIEATLDPFTLDKHGYLTIHGTEGEHSPSELSLLVGHGLEYDHLQVSGEIDMDGVANASALVSLYDNHVHIQSSFESDLLDMTMMFHSNNPLHETFDYFFNATVSDADL